MRRFLIQVNFEISTGITVDILFIRSIRPNYTNFSFFLSYYYFPLGSKKFQK